MRMPVGRQNSGPLWVDGSIALRVRDKRHRAWRMVKVRRPYAILGHHPKADLVIERADVAEHHVFLFLDARGLFGVDLRTDRGTRFAGTNAEAAWLGSGDLIEVGDHAIEVIQLRVNGMILAGPLSDDDPLGLMPPDLGKAPSELTLRLVADPNANWSIGSSLVFLGRGPACAVQLTDESIGPTHSAILRDGPAVYLINFPGQATRINDAPSPPAARLADADTITIGGDSLLVRAHDIPPVAAPRSFDQLVNRLELAAGHENYADVGFAFENHRAVPQTGSGPIDYPSLIGRLQAETAALVAVLLRRIEALDDEMASLRERLDADDRARVDAQPAPVEKLRWDLIPQAEPEPDAIAQPGHWLVERLRDLEHERQTTWTNLLSRITPGKPPN